MQSGHGALTCPPSRLRCWEYQAEQTGMAQLYCPQWQLSGFDPVGQQLFHSLHGAYLSPGPVYMMPGELDAELQGLEAVDHSKLSVSLLQTQTRGCSQPHSCFTVQQALNDTLM